MFILHGMIEMEPAAIEEDERRDFMIPEYKMDATKAVDNGLDLGVELPDTPSVIIHYLLDGPNATQILPNWAEAMLGYSSDRDKGEPKA